MAMKLQEKSPNESSSMRRTAALNLERGLRALDQRGEAGLQAEIDRMYPGTKASPAPKMRRVDLGEGWHAQVLNDPRDYVPIISRYRRLSRNSSGESSTAGIQAKPEPTE
jgi:hypothetical protein